MGLQGLYTGLGDKLRAQLAAGGRAEPFTPEQRARREELLAHQRHQIAALDEQLEQCEARCRSVRASLHEARPFEYDRLAATREALERDGSVRAHPELRECVQRADAWLELTELRCERQELIESCERLQEALESR